MAKKKIVRPLNIKALDDSSGTFEGYGAVFGNIDSYGDVITRGAFQNYLSMNKPSNVKLLWQHNTEEPIGVYDDIQEDENGLYVKGRLLIDDVDRAKECYALLKAGAISGLSIGYTVNQNGSKMGIDGNRYLSDLKLWEISVVTFPANPEANIESVKNMTIKDFERFLRDAGFSKSEALQIASHGFKSRNRCDTENDDLTSLLKQLNELNSIIKGVAP
jgi:HK97 family phage prohead protease